MFTSEDWAALCDAGRRQTWRKGATLLREGDTDGRVVALTEGRVKIVVVAPTGRELVLAVRGPGELVGEMAALDGMPRSASAMALEPVAGQVLTTSEFHARLDAHPRLALVLLRNLAGRLRAAGRDSVDRADADVLTRVARRLSDLGERYGEHNGATLAIGLPLTQDDLAAWTGSSREAVNRALSDLRAAGVVTTGRQRIVVSDLAGLRHLAGH